MAAHLDDERAALVRDFLAGLVVEARAGLALGFLPGARDGFAASEHGRWSFAELVKQDMARLVDHPPGSEEHDHRVELELLVADGIELWPAELVAGVGFRCRVPLPLDELPAIAAALEVDLDAFRLRAADCGITRVTELP